MIIELNNVSVDSCSGGSKCECLGIRAWWGNIWPLTEELPTAVACECWCCTGIGGREYVFQETKHHCHAQSSSPELTSGRRSPHSIGPKQRHGWVEATS